MRYILFFLISFLLSLVLTPLVRIIAIRQGLVSYPRIDRWHQKPTAILGGVGVYLAAMIPALFLIPINRHIAGVFLGSTFLFIVGLLDDKFHFTPYVKLFTQIIAACIAVFFGISINLPPDSVLAVLLTLLWIVGITNSFNLLDNIDGLAAGIAVISSLLLFYSSLGLSSDPVYIFALILSGAALGFLPYNFNPAKIFMGDSGSMFLGYALALISISGATRHIPNLLITMLLPVLILSVPIFDTIFVMVARKLQGKSLFTGGKDHTSHRLVTLGLSQRKTVILLYAISIAFGSIAVLYSRLNIFVISIISFLAVVILVFFGLYLFEFSEGSLSNGKPRALLARNNLKSGKIIVNNMLLHKRRIVEVIIDLAFVCIAYYAAYFLRFEGTFLPANMVLLKESLVWIILIKMSVFFLFGLYRGVWRYISISDFFTIFKVACLGSVFSILFITFAFRFQEYSRAVFFMDWLILLFLITGSRFMFRMIGEFFTRIKKSGRNTIIFGAGDMGEMVLREIKRNKALDYNVVGLVDDDLSKIGNKIQGVRVLGPRAAMKSLIKEKDIKEVIIAVSAIDMDSFLDIIKICKESGISYRKIKGILDREDIIGIGKN